MTDVAETKLDRAALEDSLRAFLARETVDAPTGAANRDVVRRVHRVHRVRVGSRAGG